VVALVVFSEAPLLVKDVVGLKHSSLRSSYADFGLFFPFLSDEEFVIRVEVVLFVFLEDYFGLEGV
jgi:hypothetical protein